MEELRDELMIYCERGAYRMQWVGGQYVFRIVAAFDTVGALNPRATCSNKGMNIIVSNTDILRSDGQYPVSIANGTVRRELFDQISPQNAHKVQWSAVGVQWSAVECSGSGSGSGSGPLSLHANTHILASDVPSIFPPLSAGANRVFYLAIPPSIFAEVANNIKQCTCARGVGMTSCLWLCAAVSVVVLVCP